MRIVHTILNTLCASFCEGTKVSYSSVNDHIDQQGVERLLVELERFNASH